MSITSEIRRAFCPSYKKQERDNESNRKQPIKERPVALKRDAQVFSRDVVTSIPLLFELRSFVGEHFGKSLHCRRNQTICLLDRFAGLIHECRLNFFPAGAQIFEFIVGKEWCC